MRSIHRNITSRPERTIEVRYGVSALCFETDAGDWFRESGVVLLVIEAAGCRSSRLLPR
jgi:hypothetical protein